MIQREIAKTLPSLARGYYGVVVTGRSNQAKLP
jgi:hypothetical protein